MDDELEDMAYIQTFLDMVVFAEENHTVEAKAYKVEVTGAHMVALADCCRGVAVTYKVTPEAYNKVVSTLHCQFATAQHLFGCQCPLVWD